VHTLLSTVVILAAILWSTFKMSAALDRLTASVQAEDTVIDSVLVLLAQLADEVRNLPADDSDALNALADDIDAKAQAIASAVTANTPASSSTSDTTGGSTASDTVDSSQG
jgi:hypothetical protein